MVGSGPVDARPDGPEPLPRGSSDRWPGVALRRVGPVTVVLLAAVTLEAWLLAFHYRRDPGRSSGPLADPDELLEWGRLAVMTYELLVVAAVLTTIVFAFLTMRSGGTGARHRLAVVAALVGVVAVLVVIGSWRIVEYDDIWLIPVPNRTAFDGFIRPALSDQVAAFDVLGTKITRSRYGAAVAAHLLAAPFALLAVGLSISSTSKADRRRPDQPDPDRRHP